MEYADVNTLLKRTLKGGENYNRYFKNSSCTPTYLGTSDTAFTVSQMKAWAIKNAGQTKELSLSEFSRKNLQDTANSIYAFLYSHIQYELDGKRQNLKSPTCAWATRKQGADCKSYSIFASTILINLGIKHYFRRVKQPGMLPDKWTHVYVIVPKDQKSLKVNNPEDYYLIDATVHDNKEVCFTQKSDTLMSKVSLPHYGLQSPAIHGLAGCTCTPKAQPATTVRTSTPTTVNATRRDTEVRTTVSAPTRTVTPETTVRLRSTQTAQAPATTTTPARATTTVESARTSTVTGRTNRSLGAAYGGAITKRPKPGLNGGYVQKRGLGNAGTSIVTGLVQVAGNSASAAQQQKAMLTSGDRNQRLDAYGKTGATSAAIKTIGAAAAPYTFGISAVLALVPSEWYESVFGQMIRSGFKCTGTTWTTHKARTVSAINIEHMKVASVQVLNLFKDSSIAQVEQAINDFMIYMYSINVGEWNWINADDNRSRCTDQGLKLLLKTLEGPMEEIVQTFKKTVSDYGHKLEDAGTINHTYPPGGENSHSKAIVRPVPQFRIKITQSVIPQQNADGTFSFPNEISQAGFGTTGALIIAALIGGAYMYKNS